MEAGKNQVDHALDPNGEVRRGRERQSLLERRAGLDVLMLPLEECPLGQIPQGIVRSTLNARCSVLTLILGLVRLTQGFKAIDESAADVGLERGKVADVSDFGQSRQVGAAMSGGLGVTPLRQVNPHQRPAPGASAQAP